MPKASGLHLPTRSEGQSSRIACQKVSVSLLQGYSECAQVDSNILPMSRHMLLPM